MLPLNGYFRIVCGPVIYRSPHKIIGYDGKVPVAVPDAFFKIEGQAADDEEDIDALAFLIPMEGDDDVCCSTTDLTPHMTSVDIIEALTASTSSRRWTASRKRRWTKRCGRGCGARSREFHLRALAAAFMGVAATAHYPLDSHFIVQPNFMAMRAARRHVAHRRGTGPLGVAMAQTSTTTDLAYADPLWKAADALRGQVDAAEYKHVVPGLLFLKYISDSFEARHDQLKAELEKEGIKGNQLESLLENRDEYTAERVFWVPPEACWNNLQNQATRADIAKLIDDAFLAVERDNPKLDKKLPRDYARRGVARPVDNYPLTDGVLPISHKGGVSNLQAAK